MTKKNKLNDTNKGKYDNSKKSNDTQLNNMVVSNDNGSQRANVCNNNNDQLKNDTYESVCSPEDTAERIKTAQRHSNAVNNTISTATNVHNNSNSSMPSNANCSNSNNNTNNRPLKRVISAPVATNDTKGNYFSFSRSIARSLLPIQANSTSILEQQTLIVTEKPHNQ